MFACMCVHARVCVWWGRVGRGIGTDGMCWVGAVSHPTAIPGDAELQRWPRARPRLCQPGREALLLELSPHPLGREGPLARAPAMLGSPSPGTDSPSFQASA